MKHPALTFLLGAALLVGGCTGDGGRQPATIYLGALQTEATTFQVELSAHAAQIAGAPDVASIAAMEAAHVIRAHDRMGSIGQDVTMMGMCSDAQGAMMGTGDMGKTVDQAMAECDRHDAAMSRMNDMKAAMAEEDTHQSVMAALMARMTQTHDQMMSGGMMGGAAGMYTCPMASQP